MSNKIPQSSMPELAIPKVDFPDHQAQPLLDGDNIGQYLEDIKAYEQKILQSVISFMDESIKLISDENVANHYHDIKPFQSVNQEIKQ